MKGDDERAEQLAIMLDGGVVADEIEPLAPAVRRVRELLTGLVPNSDHITSLLTRLFDRALAAAQHPRVEFAHPTLDVRDLDAALTFYRDALGLRVIDESRSFALLDGGTGCIALRWTGSHTQRPQLGDIRLEFRTDDFDQLVADLRDSGIAIVVKTDRPRGRYAELRDPDGYMVTVRAGTPATQHVPLPPTVSTPSRNRWEKQQDEQD